MLQMTFGQLLNIVCIQGLIYYMIKLHVPSMSRVHYQALVCFADLGLKVFWLIVVRVAVCGAQSTEEGGWKLEALGLLLLLWCRLLLPHHLAVWLCMQHTRLQLEIDW